VDVKNCPADVNELGGAPIAEQRGEPRGACRPYEIAPHNVRRNRLQLPADVRRSATPLAEPDFDGRYQWMKIDRPHTADPARSRQELSSAAMEIA
jgi:hypothetical protein